MIHDTAHDSDDPPPMTARDGNSVDRDSNAYAHAVGKARDAMASASEASKNAVQANQTAQEALAISKTISATLGCSPDPVIGVPGRGLLGAVATANANVHALAITVEHKFDALTATLAADRATLAADRAAADKAAEGRRVSVARVIGWIAGPAFSIAVAALAGYLAGFHR